MKKSMPMSMSTILGILFFGSVWGVSEVFLGEALYSAGFRYASVPLTIIALGVLSLARTYFPQTGTSLAIGCCAALYKCLAMLSAFAGTPVFACHLLGIVLLGAVYDVVFSTLSNKNKAVCAIAVTYMSYALFAFSITYVFRYQPWVAGGLDKVLQHIVVSGSLAAVGGVILVPLSFRLAEALRKKAASPFPLRSRLATGGVCFVTAALWIVAIAV